MEKSFIDQEGLAKWEMEQREKEEKRFFVKSEKSFDPEIERTKRKKKKEAKMRTYFKKETKENRKVYQRIFRARWKVEKAKGRYHLPVNKEHRTYGYMTW